MGVIVDPGNIELVGTLTSMGFSAKYKEMKELIATDDRIMHKDVAYDLIVHATQEAFALAYKYPYWV